MLYFRRETHIWEVGFSQSDRRLSCLKIRFYPEISNTWNLKANWLLDFIHRITIPLSCVKECKLSYFTKKKYKKNFCLYCYRKIYFISSLNVLLGTKDKGREAPKVCFILFFLSFYYLLLYSSLQHIICSTKKCLFYKACNLQLYFKNIPIQIQLKELTR